MARLVFVTNYVDQTSVTRTHLIYHCHLSCKNHWYIFSATIHSSTLYLFRWAQTMMFMEVMALGWGRKGRSNQGRACYQHKCNEYVLRYNHTCEEYGQGEKEAEPFIRICPLGVRSCFFVTGKYEEMGKREFRFKSCYCFVFNFWFLF